MGIVMLYLTLAGGCAAVVALTRHRFGDALPLVCGGIPAALFFGGLAIGLKPAFYVLLALMTAGPAAAVFLTVRRGRLRSFLDRFLTPSFMLFNLLFAFLVLVHLDRVAGGHDEFSHWMDVVRKMAYCDDFSTNTGVQLIFRSYPPGMPLMQYFAVRLRMLFVPGVFSEWTCYVAGQLLAFSFFFPFTDRLRWGRMPFAAVLMLLLVLSGLTLYADYALTTTYIDPFLGIVAGCGFAMLFVRPRMDRRTYLYLAAVLFTLVMAKDAGLMPAVMLALTAWLRGCGALRRGGRRAWLRWALAGLFLAAAVALPKLAWSVHLNVTETARRFSKPFDWPVVLKLIRGEDAGWHSEAMAIYWKAWLTRASGMLSIPWPQLLVLLAAVLLVLYAVRDRERRSLTALVMALVFALVYIAGMAFVYQFEFGESSSRRLLSFSRYLGVPYLALITMCLLTVLDMACGERRFTVWALLAAVCLTCACLPPEQTLAFLNRSSVAASVEKREKYTAVAETLHAARGDSPARVYVAAPGDNGWNYYTLHFLLTPCETGGWWPKTDKASEDGQRLRTAEAWREELMTYDYVLVYRTDADFRNSYGALFEGGAKAVKAKTVWRVDRERGLLVPVPGQ